MIRRNAMPRVKKIGRKPKAIPPPVIGPEFYKVYDGVFRDAYDEEHPLVIYERAPHKKIISIAGVVLDKTRFNLHFPYIIFINYKNTLYSMVSKHSFVSLDYKAYSTVPFNHFDYYVCLPYENNVKTIESFINDFYVLTNRVWNVRVAFIKKWEKLSQEGFSPTNFDWSFNKKYGPVSIREAIYPSSLCLHPHQLLEEYKQFYPDFYAKDYSQKRKIAEAKIRDFQIKMKSKLKK